MFFLACCPIVYPDYQVWQFCFVLYFVSVYYVLYPVPVFVRYCVGKMWLFGYPVALFTSGPGLICGLYFYETVLVSELVEEKRIYNGNIFFGNDFSRCIFHLRRSDDP